MSQAPSTFGSMTTSSLLPIAPTIAVRSSSAQGELSALMRVHNPVVPKSLSRAMAMKPSRAACFGVGRNGVFEIAEHDVDFGNELRHLRAQLFEMRRHEMDHALEPDRQFAQRSGRTDRKRLEELARQFHPTIPSGPHRRPPLKPFRGRQKPRQAVPRSRSALTPAAGADTRKTLFIRRTAIGAR